MRAKRLDTHSSKRSRVGNRAFRAKLTAASDCRRYLGAWLIIMFVLAALYIILSGRYNSDTQKWAYGIAGAIMVMSDRMLK